MRDLVRDLDLDLDDDLEDGDPSGSVCGLGLKDKDDEIEYNFTIRKAMSINLDPACTSMNYTDTEAYFFMP